MHSSFPYYANVIHPALNDTQPATARFLRVASFPVRCSCSAQAASDRDHLREPHLHRGDWIGVRSYRGSLRGSREPALLSSDVETPFQRPWRPAPPSVCQCRLRFAKQVCSCRECAATPSAGAGKACVLWTALCARAATGSRGDTPRRACATHLPAIWLPVVRRASARDPLGSQPWRRRAPRTCPDRARQWTQERSWGEER